MPCRFVPKDESGQSPMQVFLRWILGPQCSPQIDVVVGFLVDDHQQTEAVEQEVPAAAGRVEDLDLTGGLSWAGSG